MIRVITPDQVDDFPHEIAEMHRLRYRIFKQRLRWDVTASDGMERDQFDDLRPTYLIAGDREITGAWRLLPTTGPYMLADVFPELLDGRDAPRRSTIWEASRFVVGVGGNDTDGLGALNRATHELCQGIVEFSMALGIKEFLAVYDHRIARLLDRMGHHPKWRSAWQPVGNTRAVAACFDVTEDVLAKLQAVSGIHEPVLTWGRAREAA